MDDQWIAAIMNAEGDGLVEVDLRTLDSDDLVELQIETGGRDNQMVKTIDKILRSRDRTSP